MGNRGHHAQVDITRREEPGALGRHVEAEKDFRPGSQSVDERPDVEIADRAQANRLGHVRRSYRPSLSAGTPDAALIWRMMSSTGDRLGPRPSASTASIPSMSLA